MSKPEITILILSLSQSTDSFKELVSTLLLSLYKVRPHTGLLATYQLSFHDLINAHSRRSGAGTKFDVNRNLLPLRSFATSFKKISLKFDFIYFFMILYMYIAPGQLLTIPWGANFNVNRNILSLRSFVASFKKISLKSDFTQLFFHGSTCIQPPGDKVLMSTEMSCHFIHLLQV